MNADRKFVDCGEAPRGISPRWRSFPSLISYGPSFRDENCKGWTGNEQITQVVVCWLLTKVYGHRAVGQNEKKHEVDGRYRPPGEEETEAFHHSSRFARGLHPRPFLTVTPPVPFLPRQPGTKKNKKKYKEMLGEKEKEKKRERERKREGKKGWRKFPCFFLLDSFSLLG